MLTTTIHPKVERPVAGVISEDQLFVDCLCEMLEKAEQKSRFTTDDAVADQMNQHSLVIRKVLEKYLQIQVI